MLNKPKIGITLGDPAGIGPELCLQVISDPSVREICQPLIFGCRKTLEKVADSLGLKICPESIVSTYTIEDVQPGKISPLTGACSYQAVVAAINSAIANEIRAVVTAPIHKKAWALAGIEYPGHTELFAERCESSRFCMMMTSPKITCSLVTTHIGIAKVPNELTTQRILEVIELSHEGLQRIRNRKPRLAILGLNPHAGENGLFGDEEAKLILPAVQQARVQGIEISDPLPADTAFLPWQLERFDGHVCMYHDQGLIPFKTLAFDTGVNTTLGLDVIRTSVDHGTALDIAWQGTADPSSFIAAIKLAVKLAHHQNNL